MEDRLYKKLEAYGRSDFYPFHMPGHKRNPLAVDGDFPVERDITEINGFDNLHHAEDILKRAQEDVARLYGVPESFYSINGSSGAILAAVSAAVDKGGQILVARNCHKAVYHAIYLRDLGATYIYPHEDPKLGINGGISPSCVEMYLAENPEIEAVLITSPTYDGIVSDVAKIAEVAHHYGVPLIVDNTFPTPVNCRPFEWGADIVTHSTTKYMDGHGATLGGAIVDGGKFDWMAHADKFPGLCTPDDSYHGITYAEHFGKEGAFITKATAQLMRDFGCVQSPINAYMLNLGLESLHVRMARHCENGQAVAEFLASHPKIAYVNYCGLPGDKYHAVAEKYLPNGSCGVVSFGVKGGREAAAAFMGHLKIAAIETHVADARTCCLNPASSTHRQMNDEQLKAAGVPAELVRMSCGLESSEDLIADIAQALDKI